MGCLPNNDDTVNEEDDDKGYESENCGESWKNYKDEKYITNKELEVVLRNFFEENTVWDFIYLKTWFSPEKYVFPMYCPCGKIHKPWLEKEEILSIIEDDLGDIGLCDKNKFVQSVPFFDHLQQKTTSGSLIHYGLISSHTLFTKGSPFMNIKLHETNFKTYYIQR